MNQLATLVILIIIFWLSVLTFFLYRISYHYRKLVSTTGKSDLREILDQILENTKVDKKSILELTVRIDKLGEEARHYAQKVGILRFNPFADTGGDQSFVLAILDASDTGIVLTSLHSRGMTRWYAKNVKEGKGVDHDLSKEEQEAIKKAVILKLKSQN